MHFWRFLTFALWSICASCKKNNLIYINCLSLLNFSDHIVFCAHFKSSALGLQPVTHSMMFSSIDQNLFKEERLFSKNRLRKLLYEFMNESQSPILKILNSVPWKHINTLFWYLKETDVKKRAWARIGLLFITNLITLRRTF